MKRILQKLTLLKMFKKVRCKLCLKSGERGSEEWGEGGGGWSKWPKHLVEIGKVSLWKSCRVFLLTCSSFLTTSSSCVVELKVSCRNDQNNFNFIVLVHGFAARIVSYREKCCFVLVRQSPSQSAGSGFTVRFVCITRSLHKS